MMKPGDGRFDLFGRLVEANMEATCRPYYLKEKLRKNPTTDMETVLENCFHRLQWDRFSKKAREEERARYEERASEPKRTPLSLAQGHLCGMAYMALDPPPKPDPKRQKIDESDLVPEGQFLAQNPPGSATVWVFFPEVSGGLYSKIIMPSLSEKVASLKDKLSDETTVPASKLKLSGKSGILKDNMSLAYYNVGAQDILTCLY
uniref:Putative splicing factor 3A subunit 1 n=2 Tax=Noccaea caerulescens TaxID=107243 RepID=A0A1J3HSK0_NOCCA